LATQEDIAALRTATKEGIQAVRAEIQSLGTEFKTEIHTIRTEFKTEIHALKTDFAVLKAKLGIVKWFLGGIGFGVILLIIKSFWPETP
jgi:hypothetical protein